MDEEYVSFTTIREDFCEYQVENGQIIRAKNTISKIVNKTIEGKKKGGIVMQTVSN